MDYIADQIGSDDKRVIADLYAQMNTNSGIVGEFSNNVEKIRAHMVNNNIKVKGKHASQATNNEIIEYGAAVLSDYMGSQGTLEAMSFEQMKQRVSVLKSADTTTLNENWYRAAKVDLETDTEVRENTSVQDHVALALAEKKKRISANEELARQFNTDTVSANEELGRLEAQTEMWNQKREKVFRETLGKHGKDSYDIAMNNVFDYGKMHAERSYWKKMTGIDSDYEVGHIKPLSELLNFMVDFDLDRHNNSKKAKAKAEQKKKIKQLQKTQKKLYKETDLDKREKLKAQIEQQKADIKKFEAKINPGMDPDFDPQKLADQHANKSIMQKGVAYVSDNAKEIVKAGAKGAIIGIAVDFTAGLIHENTDDGTIAHAATSAIVGTGETIGNGILGFGNAVLFGAGWLFSDDLKDYAIENLRDIDRDQNRMYNKVYQDTMNVFSEDRFTIVSPETGDVMVYQRNNSGQIYILEYYEEDSKGNVKMITIKEKLSKEYLESRGFNYERVFG
jgi:hypothetical protein